MYVSGGDQVPRCRRIGGEQDVRPCRHLLSSVFYAEIGGRIDGLVGLLRVGDRHHHQLLDAHYVPGHGERSRYHRYDWKVAAVPLAEDLYRVQDDRRPSLLVESTVPRDVLRILVGGTGHRGSVRLVPIQPASEHLRLQRYVELRSGRLYAAHFVRCRRQVGHHDRVPVGLGPCGPTELHEVLGCLGQRVGRRYVVGPSSENGGECASRRCHFLSHLLPPSCHHRRDVDS